MVPRDHVTPKRHPQHPLQGAFWYYNWGRFPACRVTPSLAWYSRQRSLLWFPFKPTPPSTTTRNGCQMGHVCEPTTRTVGFGALRLSTHRSSIFGGTQNKGFPLRNYLQAKHIQREYYKVLKPTYQISPLAARPVAKQPLDLTGPMWLCSGGSLSFTHLPKANRPFDLLVLVSACWSTFSHAAQFLCCSFLLARNMSHNKTTFFLRTSLGHG